ncbi:TolC family protein [Legionella sp. km772]|uniref:TolC family protein n=1 Tax=Legionella sp. km772 TaxID=2498111 RepID=UPI000F8EDE9C|nr:TolC family protein [Legionella sp. km772]RUR10162.1 TolC family protein [Legionella sp. km772]
MLHRCLLLTASLFLILLSNGCQVADPNKATIKVPQQWPVTTFAQNKKVDLAQLKWWKQFKNPELNFLMQKTLRKNSELKIALTKTEQAQSQLEQIKLSWLPGLNYLAGYSQFPDLGNPGAIAIAYPSYIINLLQLYKQQQSAKALYQASIDAQQGVKVALLARTAISYFVVLAQIEAHHLYQQLLKDSQAYLAALNTQYKSGLIAQDQFVEQQSKIRLIQSQIQLIRYNITASKNALHYLFDEDPGELTIKTRFKTINSNAFIPGNQPLSVLQNRPDVRQAASLLKASHADTDALKAIFFPQINLGAYLGTSQNLNPIKLGQAYLDGPLINLPVFAQIKGAKARDQELYLRYRDTIKAALRDVVNDFAAFSAYSIQLNNNIQALKEAKAQCHMVDIRYQHGLVDSLNALKCTLSTDELALVINQNKLAKLIALVTLYQDLGGGFDGN